MAGKKLVVARGEAFQAFELGGHEEMPFIVMTHVEGNDAHGVAGNEEGVVLFVVEGEGKDAAEMLNAAGAILAVEGKDDLAVRPRKELIFALHLFAYLAVVVYLAVDGKNQFAVFAP